MKAAVKLLELVLLCGALSNVSGASYSDRFVWAFGWGLHKDADVNEITNLLATASRSGLNGAVLSASLDSLCKQSPDYFRRLGAVKAACDQLGLELIPSVFSVGYGGGTLAHDRNLAEGLPVEGAPFVADEKEARFIPDASLRLINGDFEEFSGHKLKGFSFYDQPGEVSFVDTQIVHSGKGSLRLENFRSNPHGHGRISQEVQVKAHRCYRITAWVRTEGLKPTSGFQISVLAKNRNLAPWTFGIPSSTDWRKLTMIFNSLEFDSVRLYAGMGDGKAGKLWLDDWSIEEVGPINVLRRPGTPVTVRSEDGSVTYAEGNDYAPLQDPNFNLFRSPEQKSAALKLLPGSRIRTGQKLQVSWYHSMLIHDSQVTICMAEPAVYDVWEHEAKLLAEHLHPKRILLNMDEVRMGGTCQACRGKDMARLLGECVSRQAEILRRYNPNAEIYIWSDMLDPNHNAKDDYYLVKGGFTGSWKHVPKDLVIAVWGGAPREKSLRFFAEQGFPTLVACYYDADNLNDVKGWMQIARPLPNVRGFMYTPWERKYNLLPEFGKLLSETTLSAARQTAVPAAQGQWPQFRGLNASGVGETDFPLHFGTTSNVLWKLNVSPGHSSPCIWGEQIFLTSFDSIQLQVLAVSRREGGVLWLRELQPGAIERGARLSEPATATPATDGERVVVYFGSFGLACYDVHGTELWRKPLPVPITQHGAGTSPVIVGDLVVLNCDQDVGSYLLAVDKRTGRTIWRTERPSFRRGFSTPLLWPPENPEEAVIAGTLRLVSYRLRDGKEKWSVSGLPNEMVATPVAGDALIFVAGWTHGSGVSRMPAFDVLVAQSDQDKNGKLTRDEAPSGPAKQHFVYIDANKDGFVTREEYETIANVFDRSQNIALAVRPGGVGDVTDTHVVWKHTRGLPYCPSPLYYRGRVFFIKNGGLATCLDAQTGKVFYQEERVGALGDYYSSPVAAAGKICVVSQPGTAVIFRASDTLEVLARNTLGEPVIATPAVVEGILYVRTREHLFAFGAREAQFTALRPTP